MENQPQQSQQGGGLDPNVVNLAKAIRHVESRGNFQDKGASGEYGAYQFTPDTWKGASKKFLGQDIPIDKATPVQQNEVAYKQIKDWKDQGYDVGQIASMWNAGEGRPNAYQENFQGVNKYGVSYDTPGYAKSVAEAYHTNKGMTPPAENQPQVSSTTPNFDKSFFGLKGDAADKLAPWLLGGAVAAPLAALAAPEILATAGVAGLAGGATELAGTAGLAGGAAEVASPGILGRVVGGVKNKISGLLSPKGIGSTLAGEAIGKVAGNVMGGGAGQATMNGSTADEEAMLQQQISELESSMPQAHSNQRSISEAVQTMLGSTAAGNKYLMSPDGQNAVDTLGHYGATPVAGPNGTANSMTAIDTMQNNDKELSHGINKALEVEGKSAHSNDVLQQAYEDAEMYNPQATPEQMDVIKGHIKRNIERESTTENYGHVPLAKMNSYRKQHGAASRFDINRTTEQRAAHKALNSAYKKTILRNSNHKTLIQATLKEETKIHRAIKALELMHGKKMPKQQEGLVHMLLKEGIKFAGAKVGDKVGGPIGAVLGYLVTNKLTNSVDKKLAKELFEAPGIESFMEGMEKKSPAAYHILISKLREHGITVPPKLLPAPKEGTPKESNFIPVPLGEGNKIEPQAQKINRSSSKIKTVHGLLKTAQKKDKLKKQKEAFLNEPYQDESKLPVIRAGKKPRSKTSGLPVIKA